MKRLTILTALVLVLGAGSDAQQPLSPPQTRILVEVGSSAQQPDVLLPTEAYAFGFPDAAFSSEMITRFEVRYNAGTFSTLGIPTKVDTVSGVSRYKLVPPQTQGTHTFELRPCNAAGCGPITSPFAFAPLSSPTTAIGAITKVPR